MNSRLLLLSLFVDFKLSLYNFQILSHLIAKTLLKWIELDILRFLSVLQTFQGIYEKFQFDLEFAHFFPKLSTLKAICWLIWFSIFHFLNLQGTEKEIPIWSFSSPVLCSHFYLLYKPAFSIKLSRFYQISSRISSFPGSIPQFLIDRSHRAWSRLKIYVESWKIFNQVELLWKGGSN